MKIEIISSESLGVRGACCLVTLPDRSILIDPGIALGFRRHGLAPHPAQIAVAEVIRERIIQAWAQATDIVFSHFHGDHIPLLHANPYQLDISKVAHLNPGVRIWTKSPDNLVAKEQPRYDALHRKLQAEWHEGTKGIGPLHFSAPVPHGEQTEKGYQVMMTRIGDGTVFVHTSDIQLLENNTIDSILEWQPEVLLADGPPLYLEQLRAGLRQRAWENAAKLAGSVHTLILDHHLMRNREGLQWLDRLSALCGHQVFCAADFMKAKRRLLEADRPLLYTNRPVPPEWHKAYAAGKSTTEAFRL